MSIIKLKPEAVKMLLYSKFPNPIKYLLAGLENVELTTKILQEAALGEDVRPYLNTVVFGLFVGELDPKDLVEGVKEWLGLETAKSELVAALVRKTFVEPHKAFLENLYKKSPSVPAPPVPNQTEQRSNVVNLKQTP